MSHIGGIVISAAGVGSRLGHGLPKCMLDVGGETILDRLVRQASALTPNVRVVVGYREELVIEHCARHHRGVVLVRNPEFRSSQTITSMRMGARGLDGKVLFVDGDTVLAPASLDRIFHASADRDICVGLTATISDDGVYALMDDGGVNVTGFERDVVSPYEWANVLVADPLVLGTGDGFVFEVLRDHLPLPTVELDLAEVDTAPDLERARSFVAGWAEGR